MLANIVFADIDKELSEYAQKNSLVYTRYADDITISCNSNIEKHLEYVKKRITEFGFEINDNKTHIMASPKRKMVTGLVVSDRVKIPRKYKRKFKQEIYYCRKYGTLQHLKNTGRTSAVNFKEYMYGKAYYIKMVEPELGWKLLRQLDDIFKVEYDV